VQTRAFSFSDESANVAFPFNISATSPKYASPQSHVFHQSFDTAIDYFRMREIQSEWYMDLFQSGREPWDDPYPYIWKQYARMSDWFHDMPQSTLPSVRSFFELDLLYSYVYILSPSPRIPHIHEYAQRLIFEHCIAYATNLSAVLNKPFNTTKPPVTFFDAMRAYMTGRQFVDVLSRNTDVILDPRPPTPPASTANAPESDDPLAPPAHISAPPFPSPLLPDGHTHPPNPVTRAITAINDFTSVLSAFGLRFGFSHWRDRFQRESAALVSQLYQRNSTSQHTSPVVQQISPPTAYPPQWTPMPSVSPQPPQLVYNNPTTPPSLFSQQPSPFSSTLSYNGLPYDSSPHQANMSYDGTSPGQQQMWSTPSPQPMPDMPQPTEGMKRQAMVYGAAGTISQSQSPNAAPHDNLWSQNASASQQDVKWTQPQSDGSTWEQGSGQGNWG
jgi:hypothetical protein